MLRLRFDLASKSQKRHEYQQTQPGVIAAAKSLSTRPSENHCSSIKDEQVCSSPTRQPTEAILHIRHHRDHIELIGKDCGDLNRNAEKMEAEQKHDEGYDDDTVVFNS